MQLRESNISSRMYKIYNFEIVKKVEVHRAIQMYMSYLSIVESANVIKESGIGVIPEGASASTWRAKPAPAAGSMPTHDLSSNGT